MESVAAIASITGALLNILALIMIATRIEHRLTDIEANIRWLIGERRSIQR